MIARGVAATLMLGVLGAIGLAGATAIRARVGKGNETPAPGDVSPPTSAPSVTDSAAGVAPAGTLTPDSAARTAVAKSSGPTLSGSVSSAPTAAARPGPSIGSVAPLVPVGRTTLRDTMVADRAVDTVRVRFDLVMSRTRRPDKFEAIVRSTLPQVYGASADSGLRALPVGAVARAGDLLTTLAEQGFRIPLPGGRAIAVWPETREGRDGPLVVAYRAVASR